VSGPRGLSVVTATVGREAEMLEKLAALMRQTLSRKRFEWLVAFDGASGSLQTRLEQARPTDLPLRTVVTPGVGPGPARDAAAALARFDVLYLSDDDCLPDPGTLARHLEAQAAPALYLGEVVFEAADGRRTSSFVGSPSWWNVGGANASLPTASFRRVGGFGEVTRGYGGEDLWLGWRLARDGLAIRSLEGAGTVHLGADPTTSGDPEKARAAGANAVRIARREPRLAWRLGVHPWMLALKELAFAAPVGTLVGWPSATRRAYERAYARGARQAWRSTPDPDPDPAPGSREDLP
jgi:GT2 family glycosyltransferase